MRRNGRIACRLRHQRRGNTNGLFLVGGHCRYKLIDLTITAASSRLTHFGGAVDDFANSAAIVTQLEPVISVDTSMAHLAGALSKACWVMLPMFSADWRWLRERTDSPWYPGVMRLFRQSQLDNRDEAVAGMVVALKRWVETFDDARNQLTARLAAGHTSGRHPQMTRRRRTTTPPVLKITCRNPLK